MLAVRRRARPAGRLRRGRAAARSGATATASRDRVRRASAARAARPAGRSPPIVAVTTAGALEVLNSAHGHGGQTQLVRRRGHRRRGLRRRPATPCTSRSGAAARARSSPCRWPAARRCRSPPGRCRRSAPTAPSSRYASEPTLSDQSCVPATGDPVPLFKLAVRTLATRRPGHLPDGAAGSGQRPARADLAPVLGAGRPAPGRVDLRRCRTTRAGTWPWSTPRPRSTTCSGAGVTFVPPPASPPRRSYLREGVYLPDGNLFVSRACCGGVPGTTPRG